MDLTKFTGTGAFGRAYRVMIENDAHGAGIVDRRLVQTMVRLCGETANVLYSSFTPLAVRYQQGSRPQLERVVARAQPKAVGDEAALAAIVAFTRQLGDRAEQDLDKMRVGGTEEEIIRRGSDWCTDVARVACVLCQVAGFPSRLVYLFDLDQAYSGHVIIETWREARWGALDANTAVVYRIPDGSPASVWDLMNDPSLIEAHGAHPRAFYTTVGQFRAAGVANYSCWEPEQYDYTVSGLNEYYRSILDMSDKGWPGGPRWLHEENRESAEPDAGVSLHR